MSIMVQANLRHKTGSPCKPSNVTVDGSAVVRNCRGQWMVGTYHGELVMVQSNLYRITESPCEPSIVIVEGSTVVSNHGD